VLEDLLIGSRCDGWVKGMVWREGWGKGGMLVIFWCWK